MLNGRGGAPGGVTAAGGGGIIPGHDLTVSSRSRHWSADRGRYTAPGRPGVSSGLLACQQNDGCGIIISHDDCWAIVAISRYM